MTDSSTEKPILSVRYSASVPENHPAIYAHALKVEVTKAIGYPDHIFVFHRSPTNNEGDAVDTFIQIASPLDVEEIPEDAPNLDEGMPYYRSNCVTLWFRCIEDLQLAKKKIREDLQVLTSTYNVLNNNLSNQEEESYE